MNRESRITNWNPTPCKNFVLIDPNTYLTPNPEQKQCQNTPLAVAPVPSYSLLTQVMLISILINAHYLHNVVFSFENG